MTVEVAEDLRGKYVVEVKSSEKPPRPRKDIVESLKGAVSPKMMSRMKKEVVDCPVLKETVSFVQCFACSNFLRRVKGQVDCRGLPLV